MGWCRSHHRERSNRQLPAVPDRPTITTVHRALIVGSCGSAKDLQKLPVRSTPKPQWSAWFEALGFEHRASGGPGEELNECLRRVWRLRGGTDPPCENR